MSKTRKTRHNKGKRRNRSKSKFKLRCYHCHKEGHLRRAFPERKQKQTDKSKEPGNAAVATDGYESAEVLTVTEKESNKEWILDSGCSFHMCPNKSWFEVYKDGDEGMVLLGDNKACRFAGIGSIRIKMHDGLGRVLQQVMYVPELKGNLISLGMLDQIGCLFRAENGCMKVSKGFMVIMKG